MSTTESTSASNGVETLKDDATPSSSSRSITTATSTRIRTSANHPVVSPIIADTMRIIADYVDGEWINDEGIVAAATIARKLVAYESENEQHRDRLRQSEKACNALEEQLGVALAANTEQASSRLLQELEETRASNANLMSATAASMGILFEERAANLASENTTLLSKVKALEAQVTALTLQVEKAAAAAVAGGAGAGAGAGIASNVGKGSTTGNSGSGSNAAAAVHTTPSSSSTSTPSSSTTSSSNSSSSSRPKNWGAVVDDDTVPLDAAEEGAGGDVEEDKGILRVRKLNPDRDNGGAAGARPKQ